MKFTSDEVEDKKDIASDDDAGYELDDSGMIPKLEELKAAGKKEEEKNTENINVLMSDEKTFSAEAIDEDIFYNDEVLGEKSPLEEDFSRSMIIEKDSLGDTALFEYESDEIGDEDLAEDMEEFFDEENIEENIEEEEEFYDFGEGGENEDEFFDFSERDEDELFDFSQRNIEEIFGLPTGEDNNMISENEAYNFADEKYDDGYDFVNDDEDADLEQQKFFSRDDLMDDMSDVKVKFYDDEAASDSTDILSALDKIADRTEMLNAIDDAFMDVDRLLDTLDRIADSLDRIADSMELMEK